MSTALYEKFCEASVEHGENNEYDCSVKTVAAVSGMDYGAAHEAMNAVGRAHGKPCPVPMVIEALDANGIIMNKLEKFRVMDVPGELSFVTDTDEIEGATIVLRPTPLTVAELAERCDPAKKYVVELVEAHILGVADGMVHDWTAGMDYHVETLIEVE